MGKITTFLSAFRTKSQEEGNEINRVIASREKILRDYGDKRLLVVTMSEKEFEKISKERSERAEIRVKVKADGSSSGTSNGKSPREIDGDEEIDRGEEIDR